MDSLITFAETETEIEVEIGVNSDGRFVAILRSFDVGETVGIRIFDRYADAEAFALECIK